MDSKELAQFIEAKDGISKPWLLVLLRLKKLEEHRDQYAPDEYLRAVADLHQDMMNLGEWWIGREDEFLP